MATCDRISNLPGEILLHILSFLPKTKDRAKTSLISRRWRHLWTHCPSLHFSLPISFDPLADMDAIAQNYIAAVDTCLLSFKPLTLDHLSLDLWLPTSCPPASAHANSRVADRWLRFAGVRSARSLSVQAWTKPGTWNGYARIPGSLFSCRALTDLRVSFSIFPAVPANFQGFHSLKKLVLGCGAIADQTLADLLARCPLLEDLAIVGLLDLQFVKISHIELPKLKRLHLMCDQLEETAAVIEAPNLEYFMFCGDLDELEWNGSVVLREAVIKNCSGNVFHMQDVWMKLLFAISSVTVLTVNEWFFQFVMPKEAMLKNLKELKCNLDWVTGLVLHALVSNLKECPMLEKLCIDFNYEPRAEVKNSVKKVQGVEDDLFFLHINALLKTTEDNHEEDGFDMPAHILELGQPLCYLRTVTLNEFLGSKNEMCLVKFLLGSAPLLEEFIVLDFLARGEGRTEEELELLFAPIPRVSSKVQMKLSRYENFLIFLKVWGKKA